MIILWAIMRRFVFGSSWCTTNSLTVSVGLFFYCNFPGRCGWVHHRGTRTARAPRSAYRGAKTPRWGVFRAREGPEQSAPQTALRKRKAIFIMIVALWSAFIQPLTCGEVSGCFYFSSHMRDENGAYFRCGQCAEICPKQAIRLRTGSAGSRPNYWQSRCPAGGQGWTDPIQSYGQAEPSGGRNSRSDCRGYRARQGA